MKIALLSAAFLAAALSEVLVDYAKLKESAEVEFSEVKCGDWDNYKCCTKKSECKKLKNGGDKKTKKKRERERDRHCVKDNESCCGADLNYNWKLDNNRDEATEFDRKENRNTKQCDKDEVCVASSILSKSDKGETYAGSTLKELIGEKTSTRCMKKDQYKKRTKSAGKKYKKAKEDEKEKANKEFQKDTRISEIMDHGHQCGNFDNTFRCCHPDKNFCKQISAEGDDKDKYCVKKEEVCCTSFNYDEADRSIISPTQSATGSACKKSSSTNVCVVSSHDSSSNKVSTKCWYPELAKSNKYRKKKKKKDDSPFSSLGGDEPSIMDFI